VHTHGTRDEQAAGRRTASPPRTAAHPVVALQAQAGNAAVARLLAPAAVTVQRFGDVVATDRRRYRVTGGGQYAIRAVGPSVERASVWVRAGVASPPFLQPVARARTVTIGAFVYHEHRPLHPLLQDCLHAAEEIVNGRGPLREGGDYSVVAATGVLFGRGARRNIAAARAVRARAANRAADAGVGQAFVVVNLDGRGGPYPYHAAAVVAADGADRVTLEQTRVAAGDRTPRRTSGTTSVYTVGTAQSFHDVMRDGGYTNARTIVIAANAVPPAAAPAAGGPVRRARRAPDRYRPY
jgi:hypothetical protein